MKYDEIPLSGSPVISCVLTDRWNSRIILIIAAQGCEHTYEMFMYCCCKLELTEFALNSF
jgi:hypothetical protein